MSKSFAYVSYTADFFPSSIRYVIDYFDGISVFFSTCFYVSSSCKNPNKCAVRFLERNIERGLVHPYATQAFLYRLDDLKVFVCSRYISK